MKIERPNTFLLVELINPNELESVAETLQLYINQFRQVKKVILLEPGESPAEGAENAVREQLKTELAAKLVAGMNEVFDFLEIGPLRFDRDF